MDDQDRFEGKSKSDIIEELPERHSYLISGNIKSFCIKETNGWNIDHYANELAFLRIYFDNNGMVIKAVIEERKQSFDEKMEGKGKVSSEKYKEIRMWIKK